MLNAPCSMPSLSFRLLRFGCCLCPPEATSHEAAGKKCVSLQPLSDCCLLLSTLLYGHSSIKRTRPNPCRLSYWNQQPIPILRSSRLFGHRMDRGALGDVTLSRRVNCCPIRHAFGKQDVFRQRDGFRLGAVALAILDAAFCVRLYPQLGQTLLANSLSPCFLV